MGGLTTGRLHQFPLAWPVATGKNGRGGGANWEIGMSLMAGAAKVVTS